MSGRPILTAEAMRSAEQKAIDGGTSVEELMERAGAALAEAVYRFAGPTPALVLCGPAITAATVMSLRVSLPPVASRSASRL